jgi:hypothetical protein
MDTKSVVTLTRARVDEVTLSTAGATVDLLEATLADGKKVYQLVETKAAARAAKSRKDPVAAVLALPGFWPLAPGGPDLLNEMAWERLDHPYHDNDELWLSKEELGEAIATGTLDALRVVHISPYDNGFWAPDGEKPLNRVTWLDKYGSGPGSLTAQGVEYLLAHPCVRVGEPTGRAGSRGQLDVLGVKLPDEVFYALCDQVAKGRKSMPGLYKRGEVHKGEAPTPSEISALIWGTARTVADGEDPACYATSPILVDPLGLAPFMRPEEESWGMDDSID